MAALALAAPLAAQPDSTAVPASVDVPARPDSLAALPAAPPAALVGPFAPAGGRALAPVPATTAALDLGGLLADVPGAFAYAAGAPGHTAGVALDGRGPDAHGVALDGRPLDDLVTGAPRLDLLPLALVGRLGAADGTQGRALGVSASARDFRLAVPVTELRYLGGQDGLQHVSGSHAQTRRPPAFLRGGSDESRLTLTGHAASRGADAPLDGGDLAHTDALARLLLTRPGAAVEAGVLYADRRLGARTGVVPQAGLPLAAIFNASTASVLGSTATRRTIRTEGWARARVALFGAPTEAGVALTLQRLVFAPGLGADTVRVHAARWAAFAEQPVQAGAHAVRLRLDATAEPALGPDAGALAGGGTRVGLHASAADSVRLGSVSVALGAGAHAVGGDVWPSASARVMRGAASAGVRLGGRPRSRLAERGLPGRVLAGGGLEQTLAADAGATLRRGDWRASTRAFASATHDETVGVALGDSLAAIVTALGTTTRAGATVGLGWREATTRGLYARAHGTAQTLAGPTLADRLDAALPRAWGDARLGLRADDVGDGVLDLDLAVRVRAWTDLRSRRIEPATGLLILADASGGLGLALPARAVVGLDATATFQTRASLFLRYDHALGERAYGAVVTQGEPLAPHVLRFGVFWALLD